MKLGSAVVWCVLAWAALTPARGQAPGPPAKGEVAGAVARLATGFKTHPAERGKAEAGLGVKPLQLYMRDLVAGGTTLLADEPEPGFVYCSKPDWSRDGTRVAFDVRPDNQWPRTRLKLLMLDGDRPRLIDLGPGACPAFAPDGGRIAFLAIEPTRPGEEPGVCVMRLDGTDRKPVTDFGAPFWSPDGREFLVSNFAKGPIESTVIDLERSSGGVVTVEGQRVYSWPSWAGPHTLVAVLGEDRQETGDKVALLDVTRPDAAKVIEVLWERPAGEAVGALWPVYEPVTRRCYFVGIEPERRTLLTVERGSKRARALEGKGYNDMLGGLALSPDGRYLLYCADRPAAADPGAGPVRP